MRAREVPVAATVALGHRAYHLRPCGAGFAAVSAEGAATVLDGDLRVVRRFELGERVGDVAVAPDGTTWAWAAGDRLWIGEPGGPAVDAPLAGDVACRWLPSGTALWVAVGTGDEVLVEVRGPDHHVRAQVTVPDRFGGAMVMLCAHPRADAVVLWVAAGQDGQESWLLTEDGAELRAERLPADDCGPALFLPDGRALLAAGDYRVTLLSWPGGDVLGEIRWAALDPAAGQDGDDSPGDVLLLPGRHVAWTTGNGRIRTVDLAGMSVVDEIALAGHPLRAVADLYPSQAGDETLCTDLEYAVPGPGGTVVSVHRPDTLVLSALRDWSPA